MSDPHPNPSSRPQRLHDLIAESGIRLQLDADDSRLEELRCYQHWTLRDLDTLSGITEFSEIMCAVEWLQSTLQVDLEALVSSLYLYDLEDLTIVALLLHVGVPTGLLTEPESPRTVAEYVQTALNALRFQDEYQDDAAVTGRLIKQLNDFADKKGIPLIEPYPLLQAAIALQTVLAARGYQTVELHLELYCDTSEGSTALALRVHKTETAFSLSLYPPVGPSTVLRLGAGDEESYIGGLDALQLQALETALRDRTQAIVTESKETIETNTLKPLLSAVWSTYLLPFEQYVTLSGTDREQHNQRLQPLATFLRAALWQTLEDVWQQHSETPLTLVEQSQQIIKDYLQVRLEHAVYDHKRLAFLANDVARLLYQPTVEEPEYQWTEVQNTAAKADGWLIYDVGHDHFPERDRYRLVAYHQANRFQMDRQAYLHVVRQSLLDSTNLCSQALACLRAHAPREHQLVWITGYRHLVKEALQTPEAFRTWLRSLLPFEIIGWRPLEVFLQSLGVQRSQVTSKAVWLYYWDESAPIAVLGEDDQGQPLAEAPLPQWLVDLEQKLEVLARVDEAVPRAGLVGMLLTVADDPESETTLH